MKNYELTCLISPEIDENELTSFSEQVNSFIQEAGGILDKNQKIIKKRLGYQIKRENAAYLSALTFQLAPEKLAILEKKLKTEPRILRYLISTKKPLKEKRPPRIKKGKAAVPKLEKSKTVLRQPPPKTELKEIEKKLDEILSE